MDELKRSIPRDGWECLICLVFSKKLIIGVWDEKKGGFICDTKKLFYRINETEYWYRQAYAQEVLKENLERVRKQLKS